MTFTLQSSLEQRVEPASRAALLSTGAELLQRALAASKKLHAVLSDNNLELLEAECDSLGGLSDEVRDFTGRLALAQATAPDQVQPEIRALLADLTHQNRINIALLAALRLNAQCQWNMVRNLAGMYAVSSGSEEVHL